MLGNTTNRNSIWLIAASITCSSVGPAAAETVIVKYRGNVPLDTFLCMDTPQSSFIGKVCYDADQSYVIIRLKQTYYHYCEIDPATIDALLSAPSMGEYFNQHIRGRGSDGPFDCRTRRAPEYQ